MELLERHGQLEKLENWLREAAAGQGRCVLVGGEAGVGKTSLIGQFSQATTGRARILVGACDALSTPRPLGPLLDIAAETGGELDQLVSENAPRDRIFRATLSELGAGNTPTIAIIEDAHWADDATLDLLRFLGRRIGQIPALLIVTYRDDEVGPLHPLRVVLGDLSTTAHLRRLTLSPLSEAAVRQLAEGSTLDPVKLYRQTGGNPFFVTEVLATRRPGIPPTVRDAALARAARLSLAGRETLDAAAVIGFVIEPGLLGAVVANGNGTDECLASGMLRVETDHLVFRHELARLAVLESILPNRRRALHRAVLHVLQAKTPGRDGLARLAHHAEAADDGTAVLIFAQAAARRAEELRAHREAAAQYARALRFAGALPLHERAMILEQRSYECYLTEQLDEAIAARQEALSVWRQVGDRAKQGESLRWLSRLYWYIGESVEAEQFGRAALEVLTDLPEGPQLAWAYSNLAQLRMLAWDSEEAIEWGERAIALAESTGETVAQVHALNNVGAAKLQLDDDDGWGLLEQSLVIALESKLEEHAARAYTNLSASAVEHYRLDLADRYLTQGLAYCVDNDLDSWRFNMLGWQATAQFHRGRWREASESAQETLHRPKGAPVNRIISLGILGRARARVGDPEVWEVLDEALVLATRTREVQRLGPIRIARAEAAWLAGDVERVEAEARAELDRAIRCGHHWLAGGMASWLWRIDRLTELPPNLPEPFVRQFSNDWAGAAKAWQALDCPYEAALALCDGDEAALRQALTEFDRLGARPAAAFAAQRLRDLGARKIPRGPRPSTRANPANLTARQIDILALIAQGHSNGEIASQLFLSQKTVEHHVSAILNKLDVSSRAQAAVTAVSLGLVS